MRKFFCLSAGLAACGVAGLATAGGPEVQSMDNAIDVQPVRMAQIGLDGKLLTPWVYTKDLQGFDSSCNDDVLWDQYEFTSADDSTPIGGDGCGLSQPSSRWFFGPSYCNTWTVNDIETYADGATGTTSDHAMFAWFWYGDGDTLGTEQCYLVTFTYDDFDDTCNGPAAGGGHPGVILDFGEQATNPAGYYRTDVLLCANGLSYEMPAAGGAMDLNMWNSYDSGTGNFTYATCGQAMLWGAKDGVAQGTSGPINWDDDTTYDSSDNCLADPNGNCLNVPDGNLHIFECYDYGGLVTCPAGNVGAMVAFFGEAQSSCLTLEVDRMVAGLKSTWTIGGGAQGEKVALVYGTNDGNTSGSSAGYCFTFGIKGVNAGKLICQKNLGAGGDTTCASPIPSNFQGVRVLTQAAKQGTCPEECMSNLLDMVIQ